MGVSMKRTPLLAGLAVLALAGCGGDDGGNGDAAGGSAPEDQEVATLDVGVLPIADVAPIYLGVEKGFFREENLEVNPQISQGGAAVVTGVVSGDYDFGFAATEPLIVAKSQGLPLQIVATGNQASSDPQEPWTGLMVQEDGPIQELEDLEGETIAVNALQGTAQLTILALLQREGVDVSTLKFTEVPFPDMPAVLASGQFPAVAAVEPFLAPIEEEGGENIAPYFSGLQPGMTIGTYFTNQPKIEEDPELVARFARAMNRSLEYARTHEQEVRDIIGTYTEIPPEALQEIVLPLWRSDLNRPSIQFMADIALEFEFIEDEVDLSEMIWEGASG